MILDSFNQDNYWLKNAHISSCFLKINTINSYPEQLVLVDIEIENGKIKQVLPARQKNNLDNSINLNKSIILPCLIDCHTHLDKGHIWQRSPNLDGTFDNALDIAIKDAEKYWQAEDVYRRMEFGIKCSYAHGTIALRTHIDCYGEQAEISLNVFQQLQQKWQDKITLQAVSLVSLDYYQTEAGITLADKIAEIGGILGGVAFMNPQLNSQLDTVFTLAKERNLDLDFHADENNDPNSICLKKIAEAAIRNQFKGKILCGHCCSLAVQSEEVVAKAIALVKQANLGVVSLPMCNLYLQDRKPGTTPFWRGVTKVHELKQAGIPVAFASDNCRDPFYGFGDHDVLEVFNQSVRIAHLDTPYSDWISSVTTTPADLMGLSDLGKIEVGQPANLIIFKARYFSELLSRSQHDRIVLRNGKPIDTTLPDYAELDDLVLQ
ncbi:amidohydrolase [Stanieria cyanosphaera PCC 7437]|uniref:Amidohydrolase n=1 Tax=Stanieria cyanosphaera (strain ATCC 29371 / PCC 7437) TaxID=111780 RepID=K9XSV3_STAC7|nr:cytosine deaminase [Stanieria cyanosphaera]AFZ35685.1 amidohydrolase [Stanieria cyanosphaera PCC 7437]